MAFYKKLFEVKILHHFFLDRGAVHYEGMDAREKLSQNLGYDVHRFLEIAPTTACQRQLAGYRLIFKKVFNGFLLAAPVSPDDTGQPFAPPAPQARFSFEIAIKDPFFLNYTALSLRRPRSFVYHFHNLGKSTGQFPDLSAVAPEPSAGSGDPGTFAHYPGDLASDNASSPGGVFMALRSTNNTSTGSADWQEDLPGNPWDSGATYTAGEVVRYGSGSTYGLYRATAESTGTDPLDTSVWEKLGGLPLGYVNTADALPLSGPFVRYPASRNFSDSSYEITNVFGETVKAGGAGSGLNETGNSIDMRGFAPGKYTLTVTEPGTATVVETRSFYLPQPRTGSAPFGIIDIFSAGAGDYDLLSGSGQFNSPAFVLRFKNRHTAWRYINSGSRAVELETGPNPLTATGAIEVPHSGSELPNPSAEILRPENEQYFTEIYL